MRYLAATTSVLAFLGGSAMAQTETTTQPAAETAPQSSATTTVKVPAGVTTTGSGAMKAGTDATGTSCKSASAEMTNGATETCKQ